MNTPVILRIWNVKDLIHKILIKEVRLPAGSDGVELIDIGNEAPLRWLKIEIVTEEPAFTARDINEVTG